jgi:hypothetical protein
MSVAVSKFAEHGSRRRVSTLPVGSRSGATVTTKRRCWSSPRPQPPTLPTSYTTSSVLTSDAYGRCRFLYAFSVARNRVNSWLSVFRAAPALSGLGACLVFLHQRQEAR